MSLIWSRKHSCKKLRFVNIFDCLFDLVQTALMQRVEIFKSVWFVKYMVFVVPNRKAASMSIIVLLYKMNGLKI